MNTLLLTFLLSFATASMGSKDYVGHTSCFASAAVASDDNSYQSSEDFYTSHISHSAPVRKFAGGDDEEFDDHTAFVDLPDVDPTNTPDTPSIPVGDALCPLFLLLGMYVICRYRKYQPSSQSTKHL